MSLLDPFEGLTDAAPVSDGATAPPLAGGSAYTNPASGKRVIYIDTQQKFLLWLARLESVVVALRQQGEVAKVAIDTETTANRRVLKLYEAAQAELAKVKAQFDALAPNHPDAKTALALLADQRTKVNTLAKEAKKAGLNVGNGQVRLIQIYRGGDAVLVFDRWKISPGEWADLCSRFLNTDVIQWVCHNAYFDVRMLHQHGARPANPVECTLLQAHALEPLTTVRKTLAARCEKVLGYKLSKELQNSDWSKDQLDYDQVAYAASDVVSTFDLFFAQKQLLELKQPDPRSKPAEIYRLMADTIPAVTEVHVAGLQFDLGVHAQLTADLEKQDREGHDNALAALSAVGLGVMVDNPGSTRQISNWLKAALDHPDTKGSPRWPRTATGQYAVGREDLLLNVGQLGARFQPAVRALATWYKAKKLNSTLGASFARWVNVTTNRIHANFRIGTETGRFSVTEPALQTISRGDEFRSLFRARDGYLLVVCDYGTIELRVAAVVANDPVMIRAIEEGADIHSMTAALAFGREPLVRAHLKETLARHPELSGAHRIEWAKNKFFVSFFKEGAGKALRDAAKTTVFATLYGAGPANISGQLRAKGIDCDEQRARDLQQAIFDLFERLGEWITETRMDALGSRDFDHPGSMHVWTPGGRWYMPDTPTQLYTKAVNTPIQGGAAEIMLRALAYFPHSWGGIDAKLVHIVHDELIAEVRADQAPQAKEIMERAMRVAARERFPTIPMTKLVDGNIGHTWKDAK